VKVVLTDQVFPNTDIERAILAEINAELTVVENSTVDEIRRAAHDADALLNTYAAINRETLGHLTACKVIARYGIGVDNIDLEAARQSGVVVTNVPDYCVDEVADHTIALLLAVVRKVVAGHNHTVSGGWGIDSLRPVHRLRGQTLGLIGFGNIAREVAKRARSFGLDVQSYDPYIDETVFGSEGVRRSGELTDLLATSDIVSVHVPLVDATRGLLGEEAIALIRPNSIVLNTSRGPIVDADAVVDALTSGHLAGAGLDVFPTEPPDATNFHTTPNLVVTPHMAFYSDESIAESQTKAAQCIVAVLRGDEPAYRVT
jgi:D-3-phosphoglycerate dehydrogenase